MYPVPLNSPRNKATADEGAAIAFPRLGRRAPDRSLELRLTNIGSNRVNQFELSNKPIPIDHAEFPRGMAQGREDLPPEHKHAFEMHMTACGACARNVRLGEDLFKQLLALNSQPPDGTRLLSALRFARWFRMVLAIESPKRAK